MTRTFLRRVSSGNLLDTDPVQSLSNRELEVFEMIGNAMTTQQIAQTEPQPQDHRGPSRKDQVQAQSVERRGTQSPRRPVGARKQLRRAGKAGGSRREAGGGKCRGTAQFIRAATDSVSPRMTLLPTRDTSLRAVCSGERVPFGGGRGRPETAGGRQGGGREAGGGKCRGTAQFIRAATDSVSPRMTLLPTRDTSLEQCAAASVSHLEAGGEGRRQQAGGQDTFARWYRNRISSRALGRRLCAYCHRVSPPGATIRRAAECESPKGIAQFRPERTARYTITSTSMFPACRLPPAASHAASRPLPPASPRLLPPACCLPPAASRLPPPACCLPPAASRLLPPACRLPPAGSRLPPPACCLPPAASRLLPPACRLPPAASRLPPPACCLPPAASRLPPPACCLPPAASRLLPPACCLPPAASRLPLLPAASRLLPPACCLRPAASGLLPPACCLPPAASGLLPPAFPSCSLDGCRERGRKYVLSSFQGARFR